MEDILLKNLLDDYFSKHEDEYLEDLAALIAINSEKGEEKEGRPFGDGPYEALAAMLELGRRYGFDTGCVDNCVGYIEYGNTKADFSEGNLNHSDSRQLDILAHMDVVPAGEGWTMTEPFVLKKDGDILYGRGTSDDKGPALAALYSMRALKENGIVLKKPVRLVLGTDEECGSGDLPHYYARFKEAPYSFTPDSDFPLINVEKGRFTGVLSSKIEESRELPRLLRLDSGFKTNVIPGKATAELEGDVFSEASFVAAKVQALTGVSFVVSRTAADTVLVEAEGVQGHAAHPQDGKNALTAMLALLNAMEFAYSDGQRKINALAHIFPHGDWMGRAAGIAMSDEISGKLTLSLNVMHYDPSGLRGEFDSRTCVSADEKKLDMLRLNLESAGISLDTSLTEPHVVPGDSFFVQTLLECYEVFSGKEGKCMATGGGTYVHELKNGVAFGCAVEGFDNNMHGADEKASLDILMMSGKIFALAIARLCGSEE